MNDPYATRGSAPEESPSVPDDSSAQPKRIGRYRVERVLGEGGFGRVYLAHDDQLNRPVAIKVPHRHQLSQPHDAAAYLVEARILASLDHPNIVPVHDVGSTGDGLPFIVSKFIEGSDLARKMKEARPSAGLLAELLAMVAEALHYAHRQRLVHRDIKPGNILIDTSGKPYVADFGLALREEEFGTGPSIAGTPAYMSPEQARREGHRVDARSDIFSLGVVFYELLTGVLPFGGQNLYEVLQAIKTLEPCPPRQRDDTIPKELERICLKALAKRASERYTTAKDMADDLRHFLAGASIAERSLVTGGKRSEVDVATPMYSPMPTPSDQQAIKIVPKGLRSFDAGDADFFLELLPGPRDREGLPDSIRFWKTRIEETDADKTFSVGLIYGPSGCGKSSLVKAGLLPRLADSVTAVYVEATAEETEARLLKGLRKQCPDLAVDLGLIESLALLRRGQGNAAGKKVLIVLDQFEQWLHAKRQEENTELVQTLRHCDGERVQCIVMVRDDFWLAVSRFMKELEVRVVEGQNSALVDLFDKDHARKVLAAFGRAFGKLSPNPGEMSKDHKQFLEQAIHGLTQEGKIICVRLAAFAEMMKSKSWLPATLKKVGGTEGIGVTFLEETFSAATAPPEHRYHQKAARAVLKALLPEYGSEIKGHMRSHAELLAASGYGSRQKEFDDLIRILDGEIRLISPTDPEGQNAESDTYSEIQAGQRYYQLTHDYLVHSLWGWLTRKQKETRTGRAELLLADRAAVWNARPENRQLPSLLQWFQIRWLTQKKHWTPPQQKMMRKATRYHALRGLVVAALLVLLCLGSWDGYGRLKAQTLRDRLLDANTNEVPTIVADMAPYRRWLDPLLNDAYAQAESSKDARKQLHAGLALLPVNATPVEYLYGRLLDAEPGQVPVIRDALATQQSELVDRLWAVVESPEKGKESQRLRAAAALAKYDPESERWAKVQEAIANDLVTVPAVYLAAWIESIRPVRAKLLTPLAAIFREARRRDAERSLATDILADYAADQPSILADLLMDADEKQFAVIYPKFKEKSELGLPVLTGEIDRELPPDAKDGAKEKLAKRQANAAVALLKMNQPGKMWPLLKHRSDPRARSYLIHRLAPLGAEAGTLAQRLKEEPDVSIRRALLLSLGEYGEKELTPGARQAMLPSLQELYRTAADAGLHAATEWLLRTWQQESWLKQVNDGWAKDKKQREKRLQGIQQLLTKDKEKAPPQWYVNGQGQTMVVISGSVEFVMGSPSTEEGRMPNELQHKKRIGRTFAIAAKAVTVDQYRQFEPGYGIGLIEQWAGTADSPVIGTSWFQAAEYCNWLSKQEGLPESEWCYEPLVDRKALPALAGSSVGLLAGSLGPLTVTGGLFPGRTDPEYKGGMKLAGNYLERSGYRLPTETEWECACRARAVTSWYYGETEELLDKYAWYIKNAQDRTWPVGSKKPNDLGLFDLHGNVFTWCQESYKDYPAQKAGEASEDKEDVLSIVSKTSRVMRGSSFANPAVVVRSAYRSWVVPTARNYAVGFRPARTIH